MFYKNILDLYTIFIYAKYYYLILYICYCIWFILRRI